MTDPVKIKIAPNSVILGQQPSSSVFSYASVVSGKSQLDRCKPSLVSPPACDYLLGISPCLFEWIDRHDQLREICKNFAKADYIAVDTEFKGKKLCLVQINCKGTVYLIDPLSIHNLEPLFKILRNPKITKIFHACYGDVQHLCEGMQNIIDTQLLAQYYPGLESTTKQPIGYKKLLNRILGVELGKEKEITCSDWSGRPLSSKQMMYAANDVKDLAELYVMLAGRLGKIEIQAVYKTCETICRRVDDMRQRPTSYIMGNVEQASGQKSKVSGGSSAMRKKLSELPGKSAQAVPNPPQKRTHLLDEWSHL